MAKKKAAPKEHLMRLQPEQLEYVTAISEMSNLNVAQVVTVFLCVGLHNAKKVGKPPKG